MKLYLKDGKTFKVNEGLTLELLNIEEFKQIIKINSDNIPVGHFKAVLKYKLIEGNNEYSGEFICDSYDGFDNNLDEKCPYKIELVNFNFSNDEDNYIEFNFN